jgi:hypothetical protein
MASADDLRALNGALSQLDRMRAAPVPGRVKVDGRSLADLLAFAAEYGSLIQYYDLADQPCGDWSVFFRGDPSISLALRASLDLADIQAEFDRLLEGLRDAAAFETRLELLKAAIRLILRLVRILTREESCLTDIGRALTSLMAPDHADLLAAPARRLELHLGGSPLEYGLRHDRDDWFPQLLDHLEELVSALVTALDRGRAVALAELEASFDDHSHPPQSGLYDAFAMLFGHAQDSINRFPERLIQFYQSDVLRQTRRAATPDSLGLTFTPAKGVAHAELPRGTKFLAGTDGNGESIAYALESALTVDAASVAALRTLTITSGKLGNGASIPALVLSGTVALSDKAPQIATPFPLFGATSPGPSGVLKTVKATLGFAVASPTLMLSGGRRTVKLGLTIAPGSLAAVAKTLDELSAAAGGIAPARLFRQLLQAAFALRYSTAGGWVDVLRYNVTATDYPRFVLSFVLDTNADPFVALSTKPPAADAVPPAEGSAVPDGDMPTLVASLRQDPVKLGAAGVTVYPYALLSKMKLSALSIGVDVFGLADLQASTPTGPVDTSQPFLVFGSPPVQDATLDISSPELFAKPVTCFELALEWFGLPVTATGFRGYYKAYVIDADGRTIPPGRPPGKQFDNQSFMARLEVFNPGWWSLSDAPQYLFRTALHDPVPSTDAPLQPEALLTASVESRRPPAYYDPASSGVRLRLTEPDTAFGNVLYPPNVMATSVRLTAAASACAQKCGKPPVTEADPASAAPVSAANATGPDVTFDPSVKAAVQRAVANLDGAALKAIEDAIAESDAAPETKAAWRDDLSAAMGKPKPVSLLRRLIRWCAPAPDLATVHANLGEWLAANGESIAPSASALLDEARAMLEAASDVLEAEARAARQPAAVSRPVIAARLREARTRLTNDPDADTTACIQECMKGADPLGFPNQPWLPMAASIAVNYSAATAIPSAADAPATAPATFFHLLPFDGVEPVTWRAGKAVPLLAPIGAPGALFIGLSDPAKQLTMLFRLAPPATGWAIHTPAVSWAQAAGSTGGTVLKPLRDGTNNLRNSGIVSLTLDDAPPVDGLSWLRVSAPRDTTAFPMLAGLATNAAMASWVGPGGGSDLGTPLPAGTITKPASPLPEIGTIDQPMPSSGGSPAEVGAAFDIWLAERLRHKERGIQPWDYSSLALAAFPSLWQVAVVPASNGGSAPAPGNAWVIPVPGPRTLNIADPTIPSSDSTMLHDIATYLGDRISPFIQLTVANPPYLRITVHADLLFTDADSVQANIERLNRELIQFLSPWPPPALPPRPADYYTRKQVAHFIRHRPYVRAIVSLQLVHEAAHGWHYLTSALSHSLSGKLQPASGPALQPLLSLPRTPVAAPGRAG